MEGIRWYHAQEGRAIGPVTEAQLSALLKDGKITAESLIWNTNATEWKSLGEVLPKLLKGPATTVPMQSQSLKPVTTAEPKTTEQAETEKNPKTPSKGLWGRLFGR